MTTESRWATREVAETCTLSWPADTSGSARGGAAGLLRVAGRARCAAALAFRRDLCGLWQRAEARALAFGRA